MARLKLPEQHKYIFDVISEETTKLGRDAYVVGGYVRDMLLGSPNKDIDVVCVGPGIELAKRVASRFGKTPTVYENFGTAAFVVDGIELEFVGARKESYDRGSRKPIVEDGTLMDDLRRRDFTFNALAMPLHAADYAEGASHIVDEFKGIAHLLEGRVTTPVDPQITFSDDPLRMLRAVRFAARFDFKIAAHVAVAIHNNLDRLKIVSAERITGELQKMLTNSSAPKAFRMLQDLGLLQRILPELSALEAVDTIGTLSHKDNFAHSLVVLEHAIALGANELERWAALLHDIGKGPTKAFVPVKGWTFHGHEEKGARMVGKIFDRMKLPLYDELRFVQKLVALHGRPKVLVDSGVTDSAVRRIMFDAGADIDSLMLLVRSDFSTAKPVRIARHYRHCELVEAKIKELEALDSMKAFRPALMGDEIMQLFSLRPGRLVGAVKNAMTEAILDGQVPNEHAALVDWATAFVAASAEE